MQFITISRRKTEAFPEEAFAPYMAAEAEQARTLYAEGFARQIWHRADVPGACFLAEAENEDAARAALQTLPLVQAGMLEIVAVIPLAPYKGFGPQAR